MPHVHVSWPAGLLWKGHQDRRTLRSLIEEGLANDAIRT